MKHEFELLYFRHSIAEDHNVGGDRHRALTHEGRSQMELAARSLHQLGLRYDRALTSPYVRAVQTAEIVGRAFGNANVTASEALIPAADPREIIEVLFAEGRRDGARIAAFGHNPSITSAVSWMLGGEGRAAYLNIAPGDAVHLRVLSSALGAGGPEAILLGFYPRARMAALGGGG